ncbi:MAG TPA: hypothetical protein VM737_02590 [Gemmatimonadota bacterium]|nr:hypothetical protein [Gemmatimonadota bacterium]
MDSNLGRTWLTGPLARPLARGLTVLTAAGLAACSQRVTPEDEYSRQESGRPLLSPAEAPSPGPIDRAEVRGTIGAPPDAGQPEPPAVLFLVVRRAGATGGPPLAAQRLPAGPFPVAFAIGPADAMLAGTEFPERVTVEARLDRDGDPLTSDPGDWTAGSGPVAPGTEGVRLELRRAE